VTVTSEQTKISLFILHASMNEAYVASDTGMLQAQYNTVMHMSAARCRAAGGRVNSPCNSISQVFVCFESGSDSMVSGTACMHVSSAISSLVHATKDTNIVFMCFECCEC